MDSKNKPGWARLIEKSLNKSWEDITQEELDNFSSADMLDDLEEGTLEYEAQQIALKKWQDFNEKAEAIKN
ncbi:MAG: hypothetical protein MUE85_18215 [Microscillaceae bacterium]|jgi:hypothetical protein|nr:hypothetical protein [Microscillaceae bacterium]